MLSILIFIPLAFSLIHVPLKKFIQHKHKKLQTVDLHNVLNVQYIGTVQIGSNDQQLNVLFDTGSSIFWVFDSQCNDCSIPSSQQGLYPYQRSYYHCDYSLSCEKEKDHYKIYYGLGKVEGVTTIDNLKIQNLKIKQFKFLSVTDSSNTYNIKADGICGLSPSSQYEFTNLIQSMKDQFLIKNRVFSLYLAREESETSTNFNVPVNHGSELILGGFDPTYAVDDVEYFPIITNDSWTLGIQQLFVNKKPFMKKKSKALIDSGTSLIVLPHDDFDKLMNSLRTEYQKFCQFVNQQIYCACAEGQVDGFPTLSIQFESQQNNTNLYILKPEDYIQIQVSICVLSFTKTDVIDMWILGDIFLQKYYTVFDMDKSQIGFSTANLFTQEGKQVQMGDAIYIFEHILIALCVAIFLIWMIRKISNLSA